VTEPDGGLLRDLENRLLSKRPKRAKPVGLRYDRLAAGGIVAEGVPRVRPAEMSYWYFLANQLLISRLLRPCGRVMVACAETWPARLLRCQDIEMLPIAPVSLGDGPFDGILVDTSILLSGDVAQRLVQFRAMLTSGGQICVVAVNWEYELANRNLVYETSFRRYQGKVYLGLLKRTLVPAKEVEYIALLDPAYPLVKKLASMERDDLRRLRIMDVPSLVSAVSSVEVIEIPQFTSESLQEACRSACFSNAIVSGAPGILASRVFEGFLSGKSVLIMEEVCKNLASAFPFISPSDNPHIIAVCRT